MGFGCDLCYFCFYWQKLLSTAFSQGAETTDGHPRGAGLYFFPALDYGIFTFPL